MSRRFQCKSADSGKVDSITHGQVGLVSVLTNVSGNTEAIRGRRGQGRGDTVEGLDAARGDTRAGAGSRRASSTAASSTAASTSTSTSATTTHHDGQVSIWAREAMTRTVSWISAS